MDSKEISQPAAVLNSEYIDRADLPTVLAQRFGLKTTLRTIDRSHQRRQGPPRIRVGKKILYKVSDLRDWLEAHREGGVETQRAGRRRA